MKKSGGILHCGKNLFLMNILIFLFNSGYVNQEKSTPAPCCVRQLKIPEDGEILKL